MDEAEKRGTTHRQTLCWDCANATGGCSWADHNRHTPVKGWTAIETQIRSHNPSGMGETTSSYIVLECPRFERDAEGHGLRRLGRDNETQHRKDVDRAAIITAYKCGVRIREIEEATGITDTVIYQILKESGIDTGHRKPGRKVKQSPGWAAIARKEG